MNFLALLPIFNTLIDRIFPDKEKQDEAKNKLAQIIAAQQVAQATAGCKDGKSE